MLSLIRNPKRSIVLETVATAVAIAAAIYSACPSAFAAEHGGGGPGNGGDAVLINGKWTLLDLAEAGIVRSDQFDKTLADYRKYHWEGHYIRGYVASQFRDPRFSAAMKDGLAAMLENSGPDQAVLLATLGVYSWELVDARLMQVGDEQSTLDLSKLEVVQLGVRRDNRIQIDSRAFAKLDALNQVAFVLHELAYALTIPQKAEDGSLYQPSWKARSYVASRFQRYSRHGSMAEEAYSKDNYVFEGTNNVRNVLGAISGSVYGDPEVIFSKRPLYSPQVAGAGRNDFSYMTITEDSRVKHEPCNDCRLVPISVENRTITERPYNVSSAESVCDDLQANKLYAYEVVRAVTIVMETLETAEGRTMRPTVLIPETGSRSTEISFGSIADCKERVAKLYSNAVQYQQNQLSITNKNYRQLR